MRIVRQRIVRAQKRELFGFRLDEVYQTLPEIPVSLDACLPECMHLPCRFPPDSGVSNPHSRFCVFRGRSLTGRAT